jgi:hypothetical protein
LIIVHVVMRIVMTDRLREITLDTQRDLFRLAERDHGLSRKVVSSKSGIEYDALGTYWRGEHVMPIPAVLKLCDVVPDYLLSRLFDPVGRHLSANETHDGDLDDVGREAAGFTADYVNAVTSDGKITSIEKNKLRNRAERLASVAGNAAAAAG